MTDMTRTAQSSLYGIPLLGSRIVRMLYAGGNGNLTWNTLVARAGANPKDYSALMDLSLLLRLTQNSGAASDLQKVAVRIQPVYHRIFGDGKGLQIAVFVTAADMIANTPVEYLLEGSNVTLYYVFIDQESPVIPELPPIDVAFMAIGESPATTSVLANLQRLLDAWDVPIFNGAIERIALLTRDRLHDVLAKEPSIASPRMLRLSRQELITIGRIDRSRDPMQSPLIYPLVVRPVGTHCGTDQELLESADDLPGYLDTRPHAFFYASEFVDYSGADGLFRKMRIAVIGGLPYAAHLAVSTQWKVHYLSADMHLHADRRAEEQQWMTDFGDFARRHAQAFAALTKCFDVDYFCIDCAETTNGRLLIFEADTIMLVHDLDSEALFPYKRPVLQKLFGAFQRALCERAACENRTLRTSCSVQSGRNPCFDGEPRLIRTSSHA
jgi:hypothetical protein